MQIVIDIPQNVYDIMQFTKCVVQGDRSIVNKAIFNGVVLPEHHGKLKDYGYIIDAIDDWYNSCEHRRINGIDYLRKRIDDIPTVLEGVK